MMPLAAEIFEEFPVLETNRFLLRELRPSDAGALLAIRQDDRVNSFVPREPVRDLEEAQEIIRRSQQDFSEGRGIVWGGVLKEGDDTIVGLCWFSRIDKANDRAELGGELTVNMWGKHYAAEVIKKVLCFGFKTMGLHSMEARVTPFNRSTLHLIERLGFEKEGHLREAVRHEDKFYDQNIYSLRNEEPNGWDNEA